MPTTPHVREAARVGVGVDFRKFFCKFASPAEGNSLEICDRGALSLPPRRVRQPETKIVSPPIVALHKFCWPTSCPATHRALRYIYQPGAMDDDAAIRAALLEAREAGDITITQYLNELKNLRAPGDAATAGGSSHVPAAAEAAPAVRQHSASPRSSSSLASSQLVDEEGRAYKSPRHDANDDQQVDAPDSAPRAQHAGIGSEPDVGTFDDGDDDSWGVL